MDRKGLVHIYTGDGKGKTTAAVGQCIRAAGSHMQVTFVQFLKDGSSNEISILSKISGIKVNYVEKQFGFYKNMTESMKKEAKNAYQGLLNQTVQYVMEHSRESSLLVLDEIMASVQNGLVSEESLIDFLANRPEQLEVVLTGRNPSETLLQYADYVTEMKKIKHPYDKGIAARNGIEY